MEISAACSSGYGEVIVIENTIYGVSKIAPEWLVYTWIMSRQWALNDYSATSSVIIETWRAKVTSTDPVPIDSAWRLG